MLRRASLPLRILPRLASPVFPPNEKRAQAGRKGVRDPVGPLVASVHGDHERGNDPPDTVRGRGIHRAIVSSTVMRSTGTRWGRVMGFMAVINPL